MAAVFLVTLYEYSPLFYISVVFLCFVVTAAMVLGWFGFDVPVILRSSDETESLLPTPEKQMVQMTNPFILEMGPGPASVADGVSLRPCCLEPCVLSCFWGCEVSALQAALKAHQHHPLSTPQCLQEALQLRYHHCHSFHIGSEDREERRTQIPADQGIADFGPLPRERYPLVSVLTLAEPEARDTYNIPLFMSADSGGVSEPPDSEQRTQPSEPNEACRVEPSPVAEEELRGRDCVVCQNAAVSKVLLPCRHACVCDSCVSHFQHCPMCRAFVQESFTLTQGPAAEQ
ncbi:cell growth regulator with RING finger domain protein 1 isoform 2-T2 [Lycodopsis pacificus]